MAETESTEVASMSIDTSTESWEQLYQDWQDEAAAGIRAQYGDRVSTMHVTRIPDEGTPTNAIFTIYADLYPEEV